MHLKKRYKARIEEFISKGYDLSTIQKLIHREYGIRLKKSSINKAVFESNKLIKGFQNISKNVSFDLLTKIQNLKDVKQLFFKKQTENYYSIEDLDSKIKNLIRIVLRDNIITKNEETFLRQKLIEYEVGEKLLDDISKYIYSKNPYYDEIFEMVWLDDVVKENEIDFIKEKIKENEHNTEYINKRFWQYSIKNKFEELLKIINFRKLIKLDAINSVLNNDYNIYTLIGFLNILIDSNRLDEIIENALEKFEIWTQKNLELKEINLQLESLYQIIDLDYKKEFQKEKFTSEIESKSNEIIVNNFYTKKDLYKYLNVSNMQQGGKWNNGYCEHDNKWFIFCNINIEGKGYDGQNFDYSNSFDANRNLNWEAKYGSKIHWESIVKISNSHPYIFTKENEGDNKWKYNGKGECFNIEDTTPVKILWKIKKENISINETSFETTKKSKEDPYQEVLNLSKTNMFSAFENYKKIVLNNNPKTNPRIIRNQFNELIEEIN
jgi:hypothetical protein